MKKTRQQIFEEASKYSIYQDLSVNSDIGKALILGYEYCLIDKQNKINKTYEILEPLMKLQEECLKQMKWCDDGIITYSNENIAEERIIELKSQREAYSYIFNLIHNILKYLHRYT